MTITCAKQPAWLYLHTYDAHRRQLCFSNICHDCCDSVRSPVWGQQLCVTSECVVGAKRARRTQQGQGGADRMLFFIPAFQMRHEVPEELRHCHWTSHPTWREVTMKPRRTTSKQPPSNDCVRPGADPNVLKSLEPHVWPPTLTGPPPRTQFCCSLPAATNSQAPQLTRWVHNADYQPCALLSLCLNLHCVRLFGDLNPSLISRLEKHRFLQLPLCAMQST